MKTIVIAVLIMVTILVALENVIPAFAKELTVVDSEGISHVDVNILQEVFSEPVNDALSESEETSLIYMREEEKLAHDVYVTLYQKWGLTTLNNIANSEATHTLAVKALLDRYGISDPSAGKKIGELTNPDLQGLYNQLVSQGSTSLIDALKVGAAIEEIDILDLQTHLAQTDHMDIELVYENLLKGSQNHLRAFTFTLQRQVGEVYVPQHLDITSYNAIVGSSSGGNGRRWRNK